MPFPLTIDNTFRSAFTNCPQYANYSYVEHWKSQNTSIHLLAGGAFAAGIEAMRKAVWDQGASEDDALADGILALIKSWGSHEASEEEAKSLPRMIGALEHYAARWPIAESTPYRFDGGRSAAEFRFAEPLPIAHPITGEPLIYVGRADAIVERAGALYLTDEKTTSQLGFSWAKKWEHSSQFTGYQWAANKAGIPVKGTFVRGISILKTKYDTAEVLTTRSKMEIDRWLDQLCEDLTQAIFYWQRGKWAFALNDACASYGGCPFSTVCKSARPEALLPVQFVRRIWDPLAHGEVSVEEYLENMRQSGAIA